MDDLADVGKTALCVGSVKFDHSQDAFRINALLVEIEHLHNKLAEANEEWQVRNNDACHLETENELLLAENKHLLERIKEMFDQLAMLTDANLQMKADIAKREGVR